MDWIDASDEDHVIRMPGLDPYAAWVLGGGDRYVFSRTGPEERLYPLLIELNGVGIEQFANGELFFDTRDELELWHASIVLPPVLSLPTDSTLARFVAGSPFTTALARRPFFDLLRDPDRGRLRESIRSLTFSLPVDGLPSFDEKLRLTPPMFGTTSDKGQAPRPAVVVGIIDDGIAFAHRRFRRSRDATRIANLWLQAQQPPQPRASTDDSWLTLFGRGREIAGRDIDSWLRQSGSGGIVDEEKVYRLAGVIDHARSGRLPLAGRAAHGTHVADLAAGAEPGDPVDWPIVAVQLPSGATADTSGARLAQWVIEGVWYILLRALEMSTPEDGTPPVVINLSYGFSAGPHDGSLPLERALKDAVERWEEAIGSPVRLVLPAGNHYNAQLHASLKPVAGQAPVELRWRIQPDDRTASHLEIWLPNRPEGAALPAKIRVLPPGGAAPGGWVGAGAARAAELHDRGRLICQIVGGHTGGPNGRGYFRVSVAPSVELPQGQEPGLVAPSGVWTILVEDAGLGADERIEAWVQRDDRIQGFPVAGRQSRFEDPHYRRYDALGLPGSGDRAESLVRRAGTLNAIATGDDPRILVIGAARAAPPATADYSGAGPCPARTGPDAVATSDRSRVRPGILAAGTRSAGRLAMDGTSVAAPQATRLIAAELAAGGVADRSFLRALAQSLSRQRSEERAGAGLLPPLQAVPDGQG